MHVLVMALLTRAEMDTDIILYIYIYIYIYIYLHHAEKQRLSTEQAPLLEAGICGHGLELPVDSAHSWNFRTIS